MAKQNPPKTNSYKSLIILGVIFFLLLIGLLASCGSTSHAEEEEEKPKPQPPKQTEQKQGSQPLATNSTDPMSAAVFEVVNMMPLMVGLAIMGHILYIIMKLTRD